MKYKHALGALIIGGGLLGLLSLFFTGISMAEVGLVLSGKTAAPELLEYFRVAKQLLVTSSMAIFLGVAFTISSIFVLKNP